MRRKALAALAAVILVALIVLPGCREREVFGFVEEAGDWLLLVEDDPNEAGVDYNGMNLYLSNTDLPQNLTFKVETHAPISDPATDVIASIYLDTDQDNSTGFTGWPTAPSYSPNDIGADYMMLLGTEPSETGSANQNSLFQWDGSADTMIDLGSISVTAYSDSIIGTVGLSTIGNPTSVDVVAIMICDPGGAYLIDNIPDNGHATVNVTTPQQVVVQTYDPRVTQEIHYPGKRISLVTGKEIDLEEVQ
ncbi:hypothetical protein GF338_02275 [candidate division WOR-3 bacterium]|nr:hypothetical protein [candidate division WOR-3 bacterium]